MRSRSRTIRALLASAALALSCGRGAVDPGETLTVGPAVEYRIAEGETHAYPVRLAEGQYLHVVVTQVDVDVAVLLRDPDDAVVLAVDGPNGPEGPEDVAAVATEDGVHRLEVRAVGSGRYELELRALGPPEDGDRDFAEALCLYAAAERLRGEPGVESKRSALATYEKVLDHVRDDEGPFLAARTERRIANLLDDLGEVCAAVKHFERSFELYGSYDNGWELAALYNDAGYSFRLLGEAERARDLYERAIAVSEPIGNRLAIGVALNNLGILHDSLGEPQKALDYHDRALAEWRELGYRSRQATSLHNLGVCYTSLGRTEEGRRFLDEALAIRTDLGKPSRLATTLTALGWVRALEGDRAGALEAYGEALTLRQAAGDRQGEAVTLELIGSAYHEAGDGDRALGAYRDALEALADTGNLQDEAYLVLAAGRVHAERGDIEAALQNGRRALELFRRLGDLNGEASALVALARSEQRRGAPEAARGYVEAGLKIVESVRSRLQSTALRSSYLARRHDDFGVLIDVLMELGEAERAFLASERVRARGLLEEMTGGRPRHSVSPPGSPQGDRVPPELLVRERRLRARIQAKEDRRISLLSAGTSSEEAERLEEELGTLLLDYEKLRGEIRGLPSVPAPLTLEEVRKLLDEGTLLLVYTLGEERSFLWTIGLDSFEAHVLGPRSEIEVLARQVAEILPFSRRRGYRRQAEMASRALSDAVLAPVAAVPTGKRLAVVADGALLLVPFAALPIPGGTAPLLVKHEVVSLPSVSVLASLRERRGRTPPSGLLAVVADPVFGPDDSRLGADGDAEETAVDDELTRSAGDFGVKGFERLPYSGEEARALLALARGAPSFRALDFDANRTVITGGALSGYRIVHFATHGLLNTRHPSLSGLVLALVDEAGRPRDGFLRLHEIADLELEADLVVLSACRTALGKEVRGEGMLGLPRGFFHAGASRVVVSLWSVNDRATSVLMERFYRGMLDEGLPAAAALRRAQLTMLEDDAWDAPYFWAPFVVQGDWR